MGFLGVVLIVIFIAVAVLLVGVILLQDEQGEGLGGIFGGGSSTPFGSRSGNVLTKFTSILGAIFLFCSFGIAWVNRSTQSGDVLAAAKKAQANQTTNWWNASVNSNENITKTSASNGTPAAGATSATNAASTSKPAAGTTATTGSSTPSAGTSGKTAPPAPAASPPAATQPAKSGTGG